MQADDDPYDLYSRGVIFDNIGSGAEEFNTSDLTARLWPDGIIPYVYAPHLSEYIYLQSRFN